MRFARLIMAVLLFGISAAVYAQVGTKSGVLAPESEASRVQTQALPPEVDTYGTTAMTWRTFSAWDFHPMGSNVTYDWTFGGGDLGLYQTANGLMSAPLYLPEGSLLTNLEFQGCDSSNTGRMYFFLDINPKAFGGRSETLVVDTGGPATPGCTLFPYTFPTPIQIDNANNSYFLMTQFTATGASLVLVSARAGYKLQISPDPATATFLDVPVGHPQHRFVEALVAAGITGGCGNGNYCPDAPLTRGQMAVFLAGALGLHWAP